MKFNIVKNKRNLFIAKTWFNSLSGKLWFVGIILFVVLEIILFSYFLESAIDVFNSFALSVIVTVAVELLLLLLVVFAFINSCKKFISLYDIRYREQLNISKNLVSYKYCVFDECFSFDNSNKNAFKYFLVTINLNKTSVKYTSKNNMIEFFDGINFYYKNRFLRYYKISFLSKFKMCSYFEPDLTEVLKEKLRNRFVTV